MRFRFNPKVYLILGSVFWILFSIFHVVINQINQSFSESINLSLYLIFFGSFCLSFYKYYDLTIVKISREDVFNTFFRLFMFGIRCFIPLIVSYLIFSFEIINNTSIFSLVKYLLFNLTLGSSSIFFIICFLISNRLISFESSRTMKSILLLLSYALLLMFIFDFSYNIFPSSIYQYILLALFIVVGVLFFNQKWVAFLPFNQKWKTILFSIFIVLCHLLIFQFFSLDILDSEDFYNVKSSLFLILLFSFNFTYYSVSTLINIFSLPTTPVFDNIQNERIVAQKVQENLIPKVLPNSKKLKIFSFYKPHFTLGGDYYDYIPINENKFLVCIADVSGKGIPAALMMSNVQASIRTMIRNTEDLKKIVEELNYQINLRGLSERFVSMFICIYDFKSKSLEYINCGHPHPLIAYNDKIVTLDKGSTVLGMFPQLPEIKISKLKISKGFDLFSYTDGLIEIQNAYGDYYGSSKIKNLFESGRKEPEEFIELVKEDVNNFKGNNISLDDTTLLMISVKNV